MGNMIESKQILVVEDEEVIRNSLRRLLERHNYQVKTAITVQESLDKYNLDDFDVIISDLRLPGAPGTDLIKATITPVLIMTSYSSIRSAIDSMKMGAVDYIAKPFEHQEMIDATNSGWVRYMISPSPANIIIHEPTALIKLVLFLNAEMNLCCPKPTTVVTAIMRKLTEIMRPKSPVQVAEPPMIAR